MNTFARLYAKKFNCAPEKYLNKLWGDNFFDKKTGKWHKTNQIEGSDEILPRGFCQLILTPIMDLCDSILKQKKEVYEPILKQFGVVVDMQDEELKVPKKLLSYALQSWINASDALLEMITLHLPSPRVAQKYRTSYLYEGQQDDECAVSMMSCNPEGPLMMFVSKMIPTSDNGRFYAFGRVFSGTVYAGKKIKIMGPNFKQGKSDDMFEKSVQKVILWMGKKVEEIGEVPCGNTCALVGIDQCIMKQGTITDHPKAATIKCMKYSVAPVVRYAIRPKNPADMEKFVSGLQKMSNADPIVQVIKTDTETIVAGCGELHLEICLKDLVEEYCGKEKLEIIKSDPIVPYKETVTSISSQVCMTKSPNKHNRLYMNAEPLHEDLTNDIENGIVKLTNDIKDTSRRLVETYEWDAHDSKKIWCFGPENSGPNIVVDQTKQVQFLNEIRDSMESSFQWASREGVISEENMRGIRFNILDVDLHADAVHRGGGQIIPTARRLYHAAEMSAQPRYQEPVYLVVINCPNDVSSKIYGCFSVRRGIVLSEEEVSGTPQVIIKGYLPVAESFGFNEFLRSQTSGQAFPQSSFDHWEIVNSDPFDVKGKAYQIAMDIRKRKGLKKEMPILSDYVDKA